MTDTTLRDSEPPTPAGAPRGEVAGFDWKLATLLLAHVAALGVFAGAGWLIIIGALVVMIFLHELGPLPHRQVVRDEGHRVLPRLRSEDLVVPAGRDRVRRQVHPARRLRADHRHEQPRPGRRRPRTSPAPTASSRTRKRLLVVSAGSIMHFLHAFVLFFIVFSRARRARQHRRWPSASARPTPDPQDVDRRQRHRRHRRRGRRARGRRRARQHRRRAASTTFDDVGAARRAQPGRASRRSWCSATARSCELDRHARLAAGRPRTRSHRQGFLGIGPRAIPTSPPCG